VSFPPLFVPSPLPMFANISLVVAPPPFPCLYLSLLCCTVLGLLHCLFFLFPFMYACTGGSTSGLPRAVSLQPKRHPLSFINSWVKLSRKPFRVLHNPRKPALGNGWFPTTIRRYSTLFWFALPCKKPFNGNCTRGGARND
jgi:hypothetical protein